MFHLVEQSQYHIPLSRFLQIALLSAERHKQGDSIVAVAKDSDVIQTTGDSATMRNEFEKTVLKNTFKKHKYARKMRESNVSLTVRSAREVITSMGLRAEETASPRQRTIFLDHRDISIISTALPERTEARTLAPCFYLCKLVLAPLCFVVKQVCLQL